MGQRAPSKYGTPYANHYVRNLGFDGPILPESVSEVPDATGPNGIAWTTPATHQMNSQSTSGRLAFTLTMESSGGPVRYSLNGGPFVAVTEVNQQAALSCPAWAGTCRWTVAYVTNVTGLNVGTNTITIDGPGLLANVSLINSGGTQAPTNTPVPTNTPTPSPTPSGTTQPNVSISSPTAGTLVSGTTNIQANASDATGVSRVEFYVDGALRGTDTSSPYSFAWDTTNGGTHPCSGAHTHSLTARAFNTANNSTTSSAVVVNMNNPSYCTPSNTPTLTPTRTPTPTPTRTPTPVPPSATPTSVSLRGDLNGDQRVDIIDFSILLVDWAPVNNLRSDLNGDGQVGVIDFSILLASWSNP